MDNRGWRFIDTGERSGAYNMALDESLARGLAEGAGSPTLRVFRWKPWAVSVGYNQGTGELDHSRCAADGMDIVRRPTGGRAILHAEELTYSVVMYAGGRSILQAYNDIGAALVRGLSLYGVDVSLQKSQPDLREQYRSRSSIPCFSSSARYEIEWRGRKLVGSAQRRFTGRGGDVLLQHGSILCGPAHRALAEYLSVAEGGTLERIRRTLREKTADLGGITGRAVDIGRLAGCIRRGFEEEWGFTFHEDAPVDHHPQQA
jgi:lipoate-protein ligase A